MVFYTRGAQYFLVIKNQQYKRAILQYDDKNLYINLNTEEKMTIYMYNIQYTQALEHVT